MFAANAFIIVTPEYNGSYTPAMKNLFDHFPKQIHKPFGIVTASTRGDGWHSGKPANSIVHLCLIWSSQPVHACNAWCG